MKKNITVLILIIIFLLPVSAICEKLSGNFNLLYGQKMLNADDWKPVEDQTEFGFSFDIKKESWPVSFVVGYLSSEDEDSEDVYISGLGTTEMKMECKTTELSLGIRFIMDLSPVNLFFSTGLASIDAEAEGTVYPITVSDDDSAIGLWFDGGLFITIAEHINVGGQVRWSKAEVTILDTDLEAGGTHLLFLVGFHW